MQYRKLFFTVFLLTLSLTSVCSAETDDTEKAESELVLPEIVVTATRLESDVYSLPFTTYRLNSEQKHIRESICTTPEALKGVPDDKRDTQRIPDGGTPGYLVFNARGGYKIIKDMDLVLAVENIFDKDYRIHGSGVNEPGRNFLMTVRYNF